MVAAIVARRNLSERRRLAAAHTTSARLRPGITRMANNIPCAPVAIDTWMRREVPNSATTIRTTAPKRSDHGARLRKTHQARTAKPPTSSPSIPKPSAPGTTAGTANLASHCSTTATTPGQRRSGFRVAGSSVRAMVIVTPSGKGQKLSYRPGLIQMLAQFGKEILTKFDPERKRAEGKRKENQQETEHQDVE